VDIYYRFKDKVPLSDKTFLLRRFKNVFSGKEALNCLQMEEQLSRKEAKQVANIFLKMKLVSHLSTDLLPFTESCFYRLAQ